MGKIGRWRKWSGEERTKSFNMTAKALRKGLIPFASQCRVCGQTEGILMYHNKNYDVTLAFLPKLLAGTASPEEIDAIREVLVPLCWRCHMIYHSYWRNPAAYKRYFAEVKAGKMYPPVYKLNDWDKLKENGF